MFKNILFISDNLYLCKKIKTIISRDKFNDFKFVFSISPFSNLIDFEKSLSNNVHVYDMRNQDDVSVILQNYDLVISIHCKQIFPENLISKIKCINIHPGYNPYNRGWYPQVFSILNNEMIGATIHEIDKDIDHGLIIDREVVEKTITDTSGSLYDKILIKEIELFEKNIFAILNNSYNVIEPEIEGPLYLKKDFNDLCKLDLNENGTLEFFIRKLRALTHNDLKNAYFFDETTNEKVYISINIRK